MFRLRSSIVAVGGVAVAVGLITLATPRVVHAVAAALVQVTNTASNPVVTQSVGQQAAQTVHLTCYTYGNGACTLFSLSGSPSGQYVVPSNESLVITSVDILPTQINVSPTCDVIHEDGLFVTSGGSVEYSAYSAVWVISNMSLHMSYPSGMVFSAGSKITNATIYVGNIVPASCYSSSDTYDQVDLYGYLTAS
jgi:hypothetical protein